MLLIACFGTRSSASFSLVGHAASITRHQTVVAAAAVTASKNDPSPFCSFLRRRIRNKRSKTTLFSSSTSTDPFDNGEVPVDFPRRHDVLVGLEAVRKACAVTNRLQPATKDGIQAVSKLDLSPVTVGDFSAQALVLDHLHTAFVADSFIAEESSAPLTDDPKLADQVMEATGMSSLDLVKSSIDLGKEYETWGTGGVVRPPRVWCLDPIDGTKGFLRGRRNGGQYCVALALLEDGIPTVGIMGCPNLPSQPNDFDYAWKEDETAESNQDTRGCIFIASKDGGCYQLPLIPGGAPSVELHVTKNNDEAMTPSEGRFCVGVEKFSDALGQCAGMAKVLHGADTALTDDGDIILARRIDSQAKYGVLARAGAEYYARLPKPGYVEWIWDHAAGNVVLTEAGGTMSDTDGEPIDFSLGAKMSPDVKGVLGSNGGRFHTALVKAFATQEIERLKHLEEAKV